MRSSFPVGSGLGRIVETNLWDGHFQTHSRVRSCYSACSPCEDVSECNHKETWVGCIVSLTTPIRSALNASRSVLEDPPMGGKRCIRALHHARERRQGDGRFVCFEGT